MTCAENTPVWLSDETFDAAWNEVLAAIRSEGRDPEAIVARAAAVLDAWHAHPASATFRSEGDEQ